MMGELKSSEVAAAPEQSARRLRAQESIDWDALENNSCPHLDMPQALALLSLPQRLPGDHWAVQKAEERTVFIREAVLEAAARVDYPIGDVESFRIGAMASGHFTGPKPRSHSLNPHCPDNFGHVIEADTRILLGREHSPHDPKVLDLVMSAVGRELPIQFWEKLSFDRWSTKIQTAYFYQYEDIGDGLGFEWEVCLNNKPYLEIADIWDKVFTQQEIDWQTDLREALRSLRVNLESEFNPSKALQCSECRWRIVSSYAMHRHLTSSRNNAAPFRDAIDPEDLPFRGQPPELIETLVDMWLEGHSGLQSLDRPNDIAVKSAKNIIQGAAGALVREGRVDDAYAVIGLLLPPEAPTWVKLANQMQQLIRSRKGSLH